MRQRTYEEAVEAAAVIELPHNCEPAPCNFELSDVLVSRREDNDPPGAAR